ncbi:MAG: hypothetical protein K2H18_00040, partial [Muribaculaceae bacterium]|nr:hypothetical protein [Muribaculaceae bacterium]
MKRYGADDPDAQSAFNYVIDWPVSGPTQVVSSIRKKIVKFLKNDVSVPLPAPTASNLNLIVNTLVSAAVKEDKKEDRWNFNREYSVNLASNGSSVTVNGSYADIEGWVSGFPYSCDRAVFRISDGKELTKDMLPSWEKMRAVVANNFYHYDERQQYSLGGDGMYNAYTLPEPVNIPIFDNDEVLYEYWCYEIGSGADGFFYGKVKYPDIAEYASEEFKTFLPAEYQNGNAKEEASFEKDGIKYTLHDNGTISCPGYEDIGTWEYYKSNKDILYVEVGYPGADGVDAGIIKDGKYYSIWAASEPFEIDYNVANDEVIVTPCCSDVVKEKLWKFPAYKVNGELKINHKQKVEPQYNNRSQENLGEAKAFQEAVIK